MYFLFFKQKTAYEMRISDWSSDVCSSDIMFDGIKARLEGGAPVKSLSVPAFIAEGTIAHDLGALQGRFPELDIGSYPFFRMGKFGTSQIGRSLCRDRVCQNVYISVVAVSLIKKKTEHYSKSV